jgi:anthranilate phosphoribosyltransferase
LKDGNVTVFDINPEEAGLPRVTPAELKGGDADHNAEALRAVLAGIRGPYRDIVLLNAGAALVVAGRAASLKEGITEAQRSIDQGHAHAALERLVDVSNRLN